MSSKRLGLRRFQAGDDPGKQAQVWLEASRIVARKGQPDEARHLLRAAVQVDPGCTEAWLQLAWLARDPRERVALLRQVLHLEPGHVQARVALAHLQPSSDYPAKTTVADRRQARPWALALLTLVTGLCVLVLLVWGPVDISLAWLVPAPAPTPTLMPAQVAAQFVPELQAALAGENWDRAVEIVAIMAGVDPSGDQVRQWTLATHMQYGQGLVRTGRAEEAMNQFGQAVALAPHDAEARLWQQATQLYLTGQDAFAGGDWAAAIQSFSQAHEQIPGYGDLPVRLAQAYRHQSQAAIEGEDWTTAIESLTKALETLPEDPQSVDLLSSAYCQRGIGRQAQGQLEAARADLEAALALRPEDVEAQTHLDEVMYALFPPKRIEVDISKQWLYVWEGDTLVYSFVTSTGLPGQDTATGHFQVLDKIPMAYSSVWRLKMPHWLGIYYVGSIENGIHALPIRPDGSVMWAGLLGQRASYGCIILDTEAAELVYKWADIGTVVDIHY
jgi:tetratricopeptide (TPR) repeat protein